MLVPARRCGNDTDVVPSGTLAFGKALYLGFDSTCARRIAIGDVGDSHRVTLRHLASHESTLRHNAGVSTLVFVHAHPDDEALLTAGTMAKASAHGHRVVLIMATDGAAGLARSDIDDLASLRSKELEASARILDVHRTVNLGYADSGLKGDAPKGFVGAPEADVASRIVEILEWEAADIVVGYDPSGGYGHPDHLHVHRVTRAAAQAWSNVHHVRLFEATLPREPIARAVHLAARIRATPAEFDPSEFDTAWTPRAAITHRVNVRGHLAAKRASQAAHASQSGADDGVRTLQILGTLPSPLAHLLLGTEYYVDVTDSTIAGARSGES